MQVEKVSASDVSSGFFPIEQYDGYNNSQEQNCRYSYQRDLKKVYTCFGDMDNDKGRYAPVNRSVAILVDEQPRITVAVCADAHYRGRSDRDVGEIALFRQIVVPVYIANRKTHRAGPRARYSYPRLAPHRSH